MLPPSLLTLDADGKYSMSSYISPCANDVISQILVVNPIQRVTIADPRTHPWFAHNLSEYLQPAKEEVFDTEQV